MTAIPSSDSICMLDVWDEHFRNDEICAQAFGALLLSRPASARKLNSLEAVEQCLRQELDELKYDTWQGEIAPLLLLAIAQIMTKTGRHHEADSFYQKAVETIAKSGMSDEQMSEIAARLDGMLQKAGRGNDTDAVRRRLRAHILLASRNDDQLLQAREIAFTAYMNGQYDDAERIYRILISRDFEPAGTHCHLARVLLTMGRDSEAIEAVDRAAQNHADAAPFVNVRIHYLRALLATLAGQDATGPLSALENALRVEGSHNSWLLQPLLVAIRPRMSAESHAFFSRLGDTVGDRVA